MNIKSIKKLNNGKYKIELDKNQKITTYDSVILNNNLLYNKKIDSETLNKINNENNYYDIYNKVIKMVSTKLRSQKEIENILIKYGLTNKEINEMLNTFIQNGIINDLNFTKAFIHDRLSFSNDGPIKIKDSLIKHGIDEEIASKEVDLIDKNIIDERIEKIVSKKIKNNKKYSINILKNKIFNELLTLGYNNFFIDNYFDNYNSSDLIQKECLKIYNKLVKKYSGKDLVLKLYQKLYAKGFSKEEINKEIEGLNIDI